MAVGGKMLVRCNPRLGVPGEDEIGRPHGGLVVIRTASERPPAGGLWRWVKT